MHNLPDQPSTTGRQRLRVSKIGSQVFALFIAPFKRRFFKNFGNLDVDAVPRFTTRPRRGLTRVDSHIGHAPAGMEVCCAHPGLWSSSQLRTKKRKEEDHETFCKKKLSRAQERGFGRSTRIYIKLARIQQLQIECADRVKRDLEIIFKSRFFK